MMENIFIKLKYTLFYYLGAIKLWQVIVCAMVVSILVFCCYRLCCTEKAPGKKYKLYISIWALYLTGLITVTFLGRHIGIVDNSIDKLFITYRYIIENHFQTGILEVLLNMMIFMPAGGLLSVKYNWKKSVIFTFFLSLFTEFGQLITGMGLFEICDLIDNTLGGVIGIIIYNYIIWFMGRTIKK